MNNIWPHIKFKQTGRHFSTPHELSEHTQTFNKGEGFSMLCYSLNAILANFLTSDL